MPQALTFENYFLEGEEGRVRLKVVPLVDGLVLDADERYAFDFVLLPAARAGGWADVYLFTCDTCGDPGCARIEDAIRLEVSLGHTTWAIPESFRSQLNPAFHGKGPLKLTFDDNAYSAELVRVMDAIRQESRRLGRNVDLIPWKWGNDEPAPDLQTHIDKLILRRKWLEWRNRVWGALDDMHLELEFPSGYVHAITVECLANLVVGKGPATPWTEQVGHEIEADVAPRLKAGLESVEALAKTLGWPAVLREGFRADRNPEDVELSELERQTGWPQAKLSLTTHAQRYPPVDGRRPSHRPLDACPHPALLARQRSPKRPSCRLARQSAVKGAAMHVLHSVAWRSWRLLAASILAFNALHLAVAQPRGGETVSFEVTEASGAPRKLQGVLYKATGAPKGAVVLVHGSSGWTDHREGHYGRALSERGYTVLAIDTFGPRGISNTGENQSQLTTLQQTRDAFAARRFLVEQSHLPARIAVMGFSRGGLVALYAADRTYLPEQSDRFAVAIPFYPSCSARPREPKPASVVFMALGERDDYTGVKPCEELAKDYANAGGKIEVKVYAGASHGFDGDPANTRLFRASTVENYMDCAVVVEPDGRYALGGKYFSEANYEELLGEMRKGCVKKGASFWTNTAQKEAATRDVLGFLDARLTGN
ncbi:MULTISPECIES: alpha/beta fold hydrolase [unclassified Variovorax]|uniref:dienelactone hydrolase family protein n=1 Tax=unclassified Variovorax TaxID=663243 RepID=UPI000CC3C328|nr:MULTISPECIES: alpha/beta fold hydrolase [unclassified Variovorax]PNG50278.1 hypothetical protein CHC06_05901 [Variovorax sp. B2]PNG51151.1 hypothetical protein CHC07_05807 [Variovorax sp. B4]VTV17361.1 hypothetical protein WDL1P1_00325 [Variovorax sp. WDL1]